MAISKSASGAIPAGSSAGIGLRIQQIRKELGLSQAALADAMARASNTRTSKLLVSQWESSTVANPQSATLRAIAAALSVSARWLATGDGSRTDAFAADDLKRAVRVACAAIDGQELDPKALAAAILEVVEVLAEAPSSSDSVLRRVARLAYRPVN
ncbi:MAG: helix-turn-helix domain-containing protein [Arenimonas sp.]